MWEGYGELVNDISWFEAAPAGALRFRDRGVFYLQRGPARNNRGTPASGAAIGLALQNVPSGLMGRIAPTHIEGLNLSGIFRFPIEEYAEQLLPMAIRKTVKQGY